MAKSKRDETRNQDETKEEKSLPAGTSLTREQAKAPPVELPDKELISAHERGLADPDFLKGLAMRIANSGIRALSDDEFKYKLSIIKGSDPRNQFEVMLALQMDAVHEAVMRAQANFLRAQHVAQQDSAGRMLEKLTRTFLDQNKALQRNRSGGDQKVTVQHVSVNDGGQAIVGHVTQTPPANAADRPAADLPATATEPKPDPMPVEGDKRRVARVRFRPKINGQ